MAVPDRDQARTLLAHHWSEVVHGQATTTVDADTRNRIEQLFASEAMSFTYCPLTQLLGKLTDHRLDALCLQRGDDSESHWDPRSLAKNVVVPWVRDNQDVLGTSSDPYISNPLRQPRILSNPPNVLPSSLPLWESLHHVLAAVEERNDPAYTVDVFRAVLAVINDKLQHQQFVYPTLPRVSLEQTLFLVRGLLEASQAGEHAMSIMAALFAVAGRRFGLWDDVRREASTIADHASGMVGDIECRRGERLVFAAEVKERQVTLGDVRSFEEKLGRSGLTEAMLVGPSVRRQDADEIAARLHLMWTRSINLYRHSLEDVVAVTMSLAGEQGRRDFVAEIGNDLDSYARTSGRLAWHGLLERVLRGDQ